MNKDIKTLLIFIAAGMLVLICSEANKYLAKEIKPQKEERTIIEVDGCQYIRMVTNTNSVLLTHKGNCNNPIHYFKTNNRYKYIIDLPEEYPLVSTDKDKPDMFEVYASQDTLHFSFHK